MTGIVVLVSDVMFGGVTAAVVGLGTGAALGALWFGLPLHGRRHCPPPIPERQFDRTIQG